MPKMVYSYSRIGTYEQCPKKFFNQYLSGQAIQQNASYLNLGTKVHEALEKQDVNLVLDDMVAYFMYNKGKEILDTLNVIALEKKFAIDIRGKATKFDDENAVFRGVIDVIHDRGILDWKTGFNEPTPRQLYTYVLLCEANGIHITNVEYAMLRTDKLVSFPIENKIFQETLDWLSNIIKTIEEDTVYEAKPNTWCKYCPYVERCLQENLNVPVPNPKQLLERYVFYKNSIDNVKSQLDEYVKETGNEIESGEYLYNMVETVTKRVKNKKKLVQWLKDNGLLEQYGTIDSKEYETLVTNFPELNEYFSNFIRQSIGLKEFKIQS